MALLFSTSLARQYSQCLAHRLNLLAGAMMVALGLKLADEVRRELSDRAVS